MNLTTGDGRLFKEAFGIITSLGGEAAPVPTPEGEAKMSGVILSPPSVRS